MSVVQVLGIRSICPFNDFRERLIAARLGPDVRRLVDKGIPEHTDPRR